jgi:alpha-glucosidase
MTPSTRYRSPRLAVFLLVLVAAVDGCTTEYTRSRAEGSGTRPSTGSAAQQPLAGERETVVRLVQPCDGAATLHIAVYADDVIRLHYASDPAHVDRGWFADVSDLAGPSVFALDESDTGLSLRTAQLELTVDSRSCTFAAQDRAGRRIWQPGSGWARRVGGGVRITRQMAADELIFGLGEKAGPANRRGRRWEMWTSDPAWSDPEGRYRPVTDPIYQAHPYFVSVLDGAASGVFLANSHRSWFDVGAAQADALTIEVAGGDIDLYLFAGPTPRDVLEQYTRVVGRATLPPLWTLGFHQCRWSYTPSSRVREVAEEFRRRDLAIDGFWLDIDYMDGYRSFTWNPESFSDYRELLAGLSRTGYKVTAIIDPGIKHDPGNGYEAYNLGAAGSHFIKDQSGQDVIREVWPGNAVFPDFTRQAVRSWWGQLVSDFMRDGVQGIWIDMNEPAVFAREGFPLDAVVGGDGTATSFAEVRNLYASLMARATYEGMAAGHPQQRPFVLTRAGFAGVHRYSAVWTGDAESTWEHLALAPIMLQGLSVSGVPFVGSDVGGFTGAASPEMYGRWFEVGAFSPFFRAHVMRGAPDQEPWSFGEDVLAAARRLLELRYRLLPYWYSVFEEATRTGAPIVRPLWFELPDDSRSYANEDEYFVGESLLVAPVTGPDARARSVYIPAGRYYDYYDGVAYEGPTTIEAAAPLGKVPLFARAGSVIPQWEPLRFVGERPIEVLELHVFPGPIGMRRTTSFYEDDGTSNRYRDGGFRRTQASIAMDAGGLSLALATLGGSFEPSYAAYRVVVHGLPERPSSAIVRGAPAAVQYDATKRTARIDVPRSALGEETLYLAFDASKSPVLPGSDLRFQVQLPHATPAGEVYLARGPRWSPQDVRLERTGNLASGTLRAQEGASFDFKVTRGSWATVEKNADCSERANRTVTAAGASAEVTVRVAAWADGC